MTTEPTARELRARASNDDAHAVAELVKRSLSPDRLSTRAELVVHGLPTLVRLRLADHFVGSVVDVTVGRAEAYGEPVRGRVVTVAYEPGGKPGGLVLRFAADANRRDVFLNLATVRRIACAVGADAGYPR